MDHTRLKIQEILQNHKITLKNIQITVNQSTPRKNTDSSARSRKYPNIEISSFQERRRNEKAADVCHNACEASSSSKFQESHEQILKLEQAWNNQKEHVSQLQNPCIKFLFSKNERLNNHAHVAKVKDRRTKMLRTQEEFHKIKQKFQILDTIGESFFNEEFVAEQNGSNQKGFESAGSTAIEKLERIFEEGYDTPRSPHLLKAKNFASMPDNFVQQTKSARAKQPPSKFLSYTPNSKSESRNYLDFLRAKYMSEQCTSPRIKDLQLWSFATSRSQKREELCLSPKVTAASVSDTGKVKRILKSETNSRIKPSIFLESHFEQNGANCFDKERHEIRKPNQVEVNTKQSSASNELNSKYPSDFADILRRFTNIEARAGTQMQK